MKDTGIIKIQRTNEYLNRWRDYNIYIDGKRAGTIANGETQFFPTACGQHTVIAKVDWCSSPKIQIDVNANQPIDLKVAGFKNGKWWTVTFLGLLVLHFMLATFTHFYYTIFLLAPSFLVMGFYLTIGRKQYLTLVKTTDKSGTSNQFTLSPASPGR